LKKEILSEVKKKIHKEIQKPVESKQKSVPAAMHKKKKSSISPDPVLDLPD
jgi:hypothetical protein